MQAMLSRPAWFLREGPETTDREVGSQTPSDPEKLQGASDILDRLC